MNTFTAAGPRTLAPRNTFVAATHPRQVWRRCKTKHIWEGGKNFKANMSGKGAKFLPFINSRSGIVCMAPRHQIVPSKTRHLWKAWFDLTICVIYCGLLWYLWYLLVNIFDLRIKGVRRLLRPSTTRFFIGNLIKRITSITTIYGFSATEQLRRTFVFYILAGDEDYNLTIMFYDSFNPCHVKAQFDRVHWLAVQ